MLKMSGTAVVETVKLTKDVQGEDTVKAVEMRLSFTAVPLADVEAGFVSQMSLLYDANELPLLDDLEPLRVSRHVSNVRATVGNLVLPKAILSSVKLTLRPRKLVDVAMRLKAVITKGADKLHDALEQEIEVELVEEAFVADEQVQEAA